MLFHSQQLHSAWAHTVLAAVAWLMLLILAMAFLMMGSVSPAH